jgi:hypothetical protein
MQEQWKEWLQIVVRIPPMSWSSLSATWRIRTISHSIC